MVPVQEMLIESHQELNVTEMKNFFDSFLATSAELSYEAPLDDNLFLFMNLYQKIMEAPWSQAAVSYAFDFFIERSFLIRIAFNEYAMRTDCPSLAQYEFSEFVEKIFSATSIDMIKNKSSQLTAVVKINQADDPLIAELSHKYFDYPSMRFISLMAFWLSQYPSKCGYLLLKNGDLTFSQQELEKLSLKVNLYGEIKTVGFLQWIDFLRTTKEKEFSEWLPALYEKLGLPLMPVLLSKKNDIQPVDDKVIVGIVMITRVLDSILELDPTLSPAILNNQIQEAIHMLEQLLSSPWSAEAAEYAFHFFLEKFGLLNYIFDCFLDLEKYFILVMEKIFTEAPIESIRSKEFLLIRPISLGYFCKKHLTETYHANINYQAPFSKSSMLACIVNKFPEACRGLFLKQSGMLTFLFDQLAAMELYLLVFGVKERYSFLSLLELLGSCHDGQWKAEWLPDFYTQLGKSLIEDLQSNPDEWMLMLAKQLAASGKSNVIADTELNIVNHLDEVSKKLGQLSNKYVFAIWIEFGHFIMDALFMARGEKPYITVSSDPKVAAVLTRIVDQLKTYCLRQGWAAVGRDKQPEVVHFITNYVAAQMINPLSPEIRHKICQDVEKSCSEGKWPNLDNLRRNSLDESMALEEPAEQCSQFQGTSDEEPKKQSVLGKRKIG